MNKVQNRVVQGAVLDVEFGNELIVGFRGTLAGLFPGIEFGVDQQAMLEIIDTDGGGFTEADGAEMPSNFCAPFVSGVTAADSSAGVMNM